MELIHSYWPEDLAAAHYMIAHLKERETTLALGSCETCLHLFKQMFKMFKTIALKCGKSSIGSVYLFIYFGGNKIKDHKTYLHFMKDIFSKVEDKENLNIRSNHHFEHL